MAILASLWLEAGWRIAPADNRASHQGVDKSTDRDSSKIRARALLARNGGDENRGDWI
jgi:hypothetical protein